MVPIALGHVASQKELIKRATRILFSDSCLLATALWSQRYFGTCDKVILNMVAAENYDLYILLTDDITWVNDGLRDSEHYRTWFETSLLVELTQRKLAYVAVSGTMEERIAGAIEAVEHLLSLR